MKNFNVLVGTCLISLTLYAGVGDRSKSGDGIRANSNSSSDQNAPSRAKSKEGIIIRSGTGDGLQENVTDPKKCGDGIRERRD
jgi:hypothetical protein